MSMHNLARNLKFWKLKERRPMTDRRQSRQLHHLLSARKLLFENKFLDNLKDEKSKLRSWISKKVYYTNTCTHSGVLIDKIHAERTGFSKNTNWHRTCKISEKEATHNNEGSLSFVVWEESHFFRVKGGGKSDCYRSRPLFVVTCKCLEICGYMLTIAFLKQLRDVTYFLLIKIFFFLRLQTNNINNSLFGEAIVKRLSGILKANNLVCCSFFQCI